jgi:hypothetical protein
MEVQKRQSVELSQASVRLRELERDVEASRDVYQTFLKRSRETEEQERLNTSAARIIGAATVPQRRSFPPPMSLIAMLGFLLGGLAASGWAVAADRIPRAAGEDEPGPKPSDAPRRLRAAAETVPAGDKAKKPAPPVLLEKPSIARLRDGDIMRTLDGILATGGAADLTRLGWPTLRTAQPASPFLDMARAIHTAATRRAPEGMMPVIAVIGGGPGDERSVAALNFALACARNETHVLLIDPDHDKGQLTRRLGRSGENRQHRASWLGLAEKSSRTILTANGVSILPATSGASAKAPDLIRKTLAQARATGSHKLAILDGPAMPWSAGDHRLLDTADALIAVLPLRPDLDESMEEIITALGPAQDKLVGVILNELSTVATPQSQGRQYA